MGLPVSVVRTLQEKLARGVGIGPAVVTVHRRPRPKRAGKGGVELEKGHILRIAELVPQLAPTIREVLAADPTAAPWLLEFSNGYVPLVEEAAREAAVRTLLFQLASQLDEPEAMASVRLAIAESNLASGLAERAAVLGSLGAEDPRRQRFVAAAEEHDRMYGARAAIIANRERWSSAVAGDVRGRSLVALLENRRDELRGASVLHVAPEAVLEQWFRAHARELGLRYRTLGPSPSYDLQEDVTALSLDDGCADFVLCHRVLEHVLDDRCALSEFRRVIRPGGILNISVPQSMNLATTNEWIVQDASHHGHVRQYGRDFEQRLSAAGFRVEVDRLLLERSLEEHLAARTYPLRVYICHRDGSNNDLEEDR
jgi:SAM-dependent methyltransferase